MYPFECFEFENEAQRNIHLMRELNYLLLFMTNSGKRNTGSDSEINMEALSEEQQEKLANNICLYDDNIHLVEVAKLAQFQSVKKFNLQEPELELANLLRSEGFQMTESGRYVVYKKNRDERDDLWNNEDDWNHEDNTNNREIEFYSGLIFSTVLRYLTIALSSCLLH